jgi:hypothetical protein
MILDYAWLILVFPLAGVLINAFFGRRIGKRAVAWIGRGVARHRPRDRLHLTVPQRRVTSAAVLLHRTEERIQIQVQDGWGHAQSPPPVSKAVIFDVEELSGKRYISRGAQPI